MRRNGRQAGLWGSTGRVGSENRRFIQFPHPGREHAPRFWRLEEMESDYPVPRAQVPASRRRLVGLGWPARGGSGRGRSGNQSPTCCGGSMLLGQESPVTSGSPCGRQSRATEDCITRIRSSFDGVVWPTVTCCYDWPEPHSNWAGEQRMRHRRGWALQFERLALERASWQRLHRPTRLIAREETLGADRQSWGALVADDNNGEALWV